MFVLNNLQRENSAALALRPGGKLEVLLQNYVTLLLLLQEVTLLLLPEVTLLLPPQEVTLNK